MRKPLDFFNLFVAGNENQFQRKQYKARELLLQEGEVSKYIYYIEKGVLRLWFNNQGKDVTFQFFIEGECLSSLESFRWGEPSMYSIETVEASEVLLMDKPTFKQLIESTQERKDAVEEHVYERMVCFQKLFLSRIKDSPQQRYETLLNEKPELIRRIPQHYLASYLGVTSVSLSRIRNRKA
ncbi:Crp/Fnr family transcriptional regulator [Aureibacter tunicatorum]|uniref:CRP-like cAMP-binding protein n=1 Tax=Aureibacter tunicatorum TaxID=866807 RepID=A0AAE3XSP9_9BACT|nr:Crp/Fnr family transcriptional regulator [Aureibacter tunicatorum]MDR6241403.1 CRP-like cAMP-binding protein [Aureibacter tunicatorum]BDD06752.1 cAMP-binding protein [Aureibacter tunicatorum]